MTVDATHPLLQYGRAGATLHGVVAHRRFSPSTLMEGDDERALAELATWFAASVLSPSASALATMHQRIAGGHHPDVHLVVRDKATVISLEALSTQLAQAYLSPREGSHQIFLIQPAEAMDIRAMSRYLKALEEPPETTLFVLLSTKPERMPDTVLSRCRRVHMAPTPVATLVKRLAADGAQGDLALVARCAAGSLERAKRLARLGIVDLARDVSSTLAQPAPQTMERTDAWWQRLTAAAATYKEEAGGATTRAVAQRAVLGELLHVLHVGAGEVARGLASPLCPLQGVSAALAWHRDLLDLQRATQQNGTPLIMFTEAALRMSNHALLHTRIPVSSMTKPVR